MRNLALFFAVAFANPSLAFNVDGFRSGMTIDDLKAYAARNALDFRTQSNGIQHAIGNFAKYELKGSFTTCNGVVTDYHRSIDPDAGYANVLIDLMNQYDQPGVSTERLPV